MESAAVVATEAAADADAVVVAAREFNAAMTAVTSNRNVPSGD